MPSGTTVLVVGQLYGFSAAQLTFRLRVFLGETAPFCLFHSGTRNASSSAGTPTIRFFSARSHLDSASRGSLRWHAGCIVFDNRQISQRHGLKGSMYGCESSAGSCSWRGVELSARHHRNWFGLFLLLGGGAFYFVRVGFKGTG